MGTLKIGTIDELLLKTPTTYATFYETNLQNILTQPNCVGIRFIPAPVPVDGEINPCDTVIAIGYDVNLNSLTGLIRYDSVPCPPNCHPPSQPNNYPEEDVAIGLDVARALADGSAFSVRFAEDDMNALMNLVGVSKIRVFYAWTTNNKTTPTFILQGATAGGEPVLNVYGFDAQPEAGSAL